MKKVLVTGGAGYIGSHVVVELLESGYDPVIVDNLSNSSEESLKRVEKITGKKPEFYKVDLLDELKLEKVFKSNKFFAVLHFAGLKAVGESVQKPLEYYDNNIGGTITLLKLMKQHGVSNLVFSSSACVYGDPDKVPITEDFPIKPVNPYGQTKAMIEQILKDFSFSDKEFNIMMLRYSNPLGAHESGLIGEDPNGIPNNLVPYIAQVAVGKLPFLRVFGGDYPTKDGTGVRDYIHVMDLADGHVKALEKLEKDKKLGIKIYNLSTGRGYSVLEVITAFEKALGKKIKYQIAERRPGDAATVYMDASLARRELGWEAKYNIERMCEDVWRWQSKNPQGYRKS